MGPWPVRSATIVSTSFSQSPGFLAGALPGLIKLLITRAGSTGPAPSVRPSGGALALLISSSRMMAVSACAPQALTAQLRGVPSLTCALELAI